MLCDFRQRWGKSQAAISADLGLGPNTMSRWENGLQPIQHPEMLGLALLGLAHRYRQRDGRRREKGKAA
jgi:transcriptional regulator with XRE-family HTH domain